MNSATFKTVLGTQEWEVVDKHLYPVLIIAGYTSEVAAGIVQRIARNWILQQEERDISELKALCKAGLLVTLFPWSETPEGWKYWALIESKLLSSNL